MARVLLLILFTTSTALAEPQRVEYTVDGVKREALVYVPESAKEKPAPVVFAFHGHGGTMRNAMQTFSVHTHWPEAIAVYMQGLPTPGKLSDPEGKKNGWQHGAGDQKDRDLKFFDAVLAKLKADHKVDESRIYSMGHSNGGGFTYLLWAERGDVLAAVAPSSAAYLRDARKLKPKPVLHVAGEADPLVKFEWQKATIESVKKSNGCEGDGKQIGKFTTEYPSKTGTPVVTYVHPGDHKFAADSLPVTVKFFKDHPKPSK